MTAPPFIESRHRVWLRAFYDLKRELSPRLPTVREYMRASGLRSTTTAYYRIGALVDLGYLESLSGGVVGAPRSLDISEQGMAALGLSVALASPSRDIDGGGCL